MIGIIDYGVGNLFSLCSSCKSIGQEAFVSGDAAELAKADRLILPGVGAFEDAAKKLRETGMTLSALRLPQENRCLASALGCSCCLKEATNTAATRGWVY